MILIDKALQLRAERRQPVRVAMVGAGFMGLGIAKQIVQFVPGMELVAIAGRRLESAAHVYRQAGLEEVVPVETAAQLERAIAEGRPAVTDDPLLLCAADNVDAILEVTGSVEYAAQVTLAAFAHGKHVVLMNAELDGTLGPILKRYADRAGVVYTACDGDQPGVQMNLWRFVRSMGLTPLVCGNVKGLHDPYRNPTTQEAFARRWGQKPHMVTSFADGTKISFEQAIVANATGMGVAKRGMLGYEHRGHVDELTRVYDIAQLKAWGGIVDYVVGASPGPGVFVLAGCDDPTQRHYLNLYKLGEGPLYSFYTPYHLCHFEVPFSVARAVLFADAVLAPLGAPVVEVVTTAKRSLQAGETLDGIGHYMSYGQCENAEAAAAGRLLPMGLAEGCRLRRDIAQDQLLRYDDVVLPAGRLCDRLRAEQDACFERSAVPLAAC
ncbi:NAD(P)H-dependent oxidoreductase [Gloeobacter morelensis]|uniref:NAD(P)-dependent oxidoreductase n=1 Tax=Gloeobacter morelensis MG652769 TaxID=2781736 RepID=A0ABY3PSD7_9CYAN|nr:SAF domain-containing protein [Gloeobacter morelensis]UFP96565.1 NAD(P)-dependent oxidoreductase [Gloeobacter morelensis MG652769]